MIHKFIFILVLIFNSVFSYSQVTYEYYELETSVDEFDVFGDDVYESNLNIDKNITQILEVKVGTEVKADSMNGSNFLAENLIDHNMKTSWLTPKGGINAIMEFFISLENVKNVHSAILFQISFFNGWRKDYQTWQDFSRIKKIELSINSKLYAEITLADTYKSQYIDLEKFKLDKDRSYRFRFKIKEVYPGKKSEQVGLSDLQFIGKVK